MDQPHPQRRSWAAGGANFFRDTPYDGYTVDYRLT